MKRNAYWKLWLAFVLTTAASFAVLGYYGTEIYRHAPPYPDAIVSESGETVYTGE